MGVENRASLITVSSGRIILNNYFQAKVGKELHKQFPEPLLVGNWMSVILHFQILQNTLQARDYLKYFQGGSKSVIYLENEKSARSFLHKLRPPRVMDVCAFGSRTSAEKNFIFLRSERWDESFLAGTSARVSAWMSVGYPAQKLYV